VVVTAAGTADAERRLKPNSVAWPRVYGVARFASTLDSSYKEQINDNVSMLPATFGYTIIHVSNHCTASFCLTVSSFIAYFLYRCAFNVVSQSPDRTQTEGFYEQRVEEYIWTPQE
jgi:hypothetical protein